MNDCDSFPEIKEAFDYVGPKNRIGYKRLHGYIVKLIVGTENNEGRTTIHNKLWAKFRAEEAICDSIWCLKTKTWHKEPVVNTYFGYHTYGLVRYHATYQAGKSVIYDNRYDPNAHAVCAGGIHYFLTLEAALFYDRYCSCVMFSCKICDGTFILNASGSVEEKGCDHRLEYPEL